MKNLQGKVVVITGAGSGIGQALALQLARTGSLIALNDINREGLSQTLQKITAAGGTASEYLCDISDRIAVENLCNAVIQEYGRVDVLINNAGISLVRSEVQEISWKHWELMMKVNFWGALYCTKTFFPHLLRAPEAAIVNVTSVFGLGGVSLRSSYCAAKFALRGLTESLMQEAFGTNISVFSVMPGGVATQIGFNSKGWKDDSRKMQSAKRHNQLAGLSPNEAARLIIRGIKRDKRRILLGWDAYAMDWLTRLFPSRSMHWIHYLLTQREKGQFHQKLNED